MAKWALVSDFDGTASLTDVGDAIVSTYAGSDAWREVDAAIRRGVLTTKGAYEVVYDRIQVSTAELEEFVLRFSLDPHFADAVGLFTRQGLPAVIVSDGFDFYIDRLLARSALGGLPRYSNHLEIAGTRPQVSFPYHGALACHRCANCKTFHLERLKAEGYRIVYFGDGHTDRCAARRADLVFAKGYLASFLAKHSVPFRPFHHFADALPHLGALLACTEESPADGACATGE
ncbi:MAG TPA: MtnX-like HAD-IB family phosphatase [Firmicutes bacterium]|nr:MtnX-like HAD-IB family phosphatase [Bacillota bacterium]